MSCITDLPGERTGGALSECDCSFVIPAYNEEHRLPGTLEAILDSGHRHGKSEIVVVDDGSSDSTVEVVQEFQRRAKNIRVVRLGGRHGKGFAVRSGVFAARGEIIVICDADLHQSVSEVPKLEDALQLSDIAIGSRWLGHFECTLQQPIGRRLSSRLLNKLTRSLLDLPFKDTQCGLKAVTRRAARQVFPLLTIRGWAYDIEFIHVALLQGLRVQEVKLRILHDYHQSRFRPMTDGWTTLWELMSIRWQQTRGSYARQSLSLATAAAESSSNKSAA